jgi:hypothetical protein
MFHLTPCTAAANCTTLGSPQLSGGCWLVTFERMSGCVQCRGRSRNPRLRSKRVESGAGCCLTGEVPAVTAIPATEFRHLIRCRRLGSRGHVLSERRVLARRRKRPHQRRSRVRREIKNRRTQDFDALRPASRLRASDPTTSASVASSPRASTRTWHSMTVGRFVSAIRSGLRRRLSRSGKMCGKVHQWLKT